MTAGRRGLLTEMRHTNGRERSRSSSGTTPSSTPRLTTARCSAPSVLQSGTESRREVPYLLYHPPAERGGGSSPRTSTYDPSARAEYGVTAMTPIAGFVFALTAGWWCAPRAAHHHRPGAVVGGVGRTDLVPRLRAAQQPGQHHRSPGGTGSANRSAPWRWWASPPASATGAPGGTRVSVVPSQVRPALFQRDARPSPARCWPPQRQPRSSPLAY